MKNMPFNIHFFLDRTTPTHSTRWKQIIGIITDERKIYSDFVRNYLQRLGR
jgi:hypothetical protein